MAVPRVGMRWTPGARDGAAATFRPGDNAGFNALNLHLPDREASVILLSNDEDDDDEGRNPWGIGPSRGR